jgi:hypothetical protein
MRNNGFLYLFLFLSSFVNAQEASLIRYHSAYSPFPDTARMHGHLYNKQVFDFTNHYNDSSVLVYVPTGFSKNKPFELVVWFHGWNNNIDTAAKEFKLIDQFEATGRNAILIFPEGPKNAPDSYGGKMENPGVFEYFVQELLVQLAQRNIISVKQSKHLNKYPITLAGHSGAYRVISKIIQYYPVKELLLFDALYGGNESYLAWLAASKKHRLVAIYTKDGGTFKNTQFIKNYMQDSLHLKPLSINENEVDAKTLMNQRYLFIYSDKAHNDVIANQHNWQRFLANRPK